MKKRIAILLVFVMLLSLSFTGCGKKEDPPTLPDKNPNESSETQNPTPVQTPEDPAQSTDTPDEPETSWDDLVGTWYLKTTYDLDPSLDEPYAYDAYESNVDARLTFTDTDGLNYYRATRYAIDDELEDIPHQIVNDPLSEDYDYTSWCVLANVYEELTYRIGLADKDTLIVYEYYSYDDIVYSYMSVYTKEGPIEFHKIQLSEDYLTGYWYMYSSEVDGDQEYCSDSGKDCWVYFDGDCYADYYDGIYGDDVPYESFEGVRYYTVNEPVIPWFDEELYPDMQDWCVQLDIAPREGALSESYRFGFRDEYTLMLCYEYESLDGDYHITTIGEFSAYSPFETYPETGVLPDYLQELADSASENDWIIAIADPSPELCDELDALNWSLWDNSDMYNWDNPHELLLIPLHDYMEFAVSTGTPVYDSDGYYSYWETEDTCYASYLAPHEVFRVVVDLPDDPGDATLALRFGMGDMGLDGGEEYSIILCRWFEEGEPRPFIGIE